MAGNAAREPVHAQVQIVQPVEVGQETVHWREGGSDDGEREPERSLCFRSSRVRVCAAKGGTEPERRLWQRMTLDNTGRVPIDEGIIPRASETAGDDGELGEMEEFSDGRIEPAAEARRTCSRIAEIQGDQLVAVAVDASEVAWIGSEIPGREEIGARHVIEGFPK
ncbi:hypothetical protein U1Q18_020119 [Sarracenia purpurea var. burkii]